MKHPVKINGIVQYELEPENSDDRHLIEIMKTKDRVTVKQSTKGGIIFEMEASTPAVPLVEDAAPTDLSGVGRKTKGKEE